LGENYLHYGQEEAEMSAVTSGNAIVANVMDEALEFCAGKAGLKGKEAAREALRNGDCCVCEYLRYALVQRVAKYLGSVDDTVKAIYTYEPEYATSGYEHIIDGPNLSPGLNLIARVTRKNAALSSFVPSVSLALTEEFKQFGCPKANALCCKLDVQVADDEEVQERIGYGALIGSLYVRPIEVWHR
jgi:hypothetical protein